jgi:hypothetical protein
MMRLLYLMNFLLKKNIAVLDEFFVNIFIFPFCSSVLFSLEVKEVVGRFAAL